MKRLYRSNENKMIAGIAGGLAEYFGVDPVLIRLIWIISIFFGGAGIFAYLIGWLIIPEGESKAEQEGNEVGMQGVGLILIIAGIAFLLRNLIPIPFARFFWPLALVALGVFLLWRADQK